MKDEYEVRIAALNLVMTKTPIVNSAVIAEAAKLEQYILKGQAGEAPAAPQAQDGAPGTEGKDPPKRRTKRASEAPVETGEASEPEQEEEIMPPAGRPSTRAAAFGAQ